MMIMIVVIIKARRKVGQSIKVWDGNLKTEPTCGSGIQKLKKVYTTSMAIFEKVCIKLHASS